MLAACNVWFYKYLSGIQPTRDAEGVFSLVLQPSVPEKLSNVKVEMEVATGKVLSAWEKKNGPFTYHVEIPFNTPAIICLPKKLGKIESIACDGVICPNKYEEDEKWYRLPAEAGIYDIIMSCARSEEDSF